MAEISSCRCGTGGRNACLVPYGMLNVFFFFCSSVQEVMTYERVLAYGAG